MGMDHLAAPISPLYYRWVYSPSKGVTLGTNQDEHPAMVKYHQALGGDINDTDLTHGYAYPIIGGWRLSDLEHMPVEDPYIINQVVRALNHEEGPQKRSEGSWEPSEYDWSRIHYGLPQEVTAQWDWDTETESYKDWPDDPSQLVGVDHEANGYQPLGDEFWGAGGCAHLALAFKNVYPQMKLATGWYDDHGKKSLSHTMAYDPQTMRGFDSYGVHTDPRFSLSGESREVDMDSNPNEIAAHMGIPWDYENHPWDDPTVNEGSEFIENHFLPGEWQTRQ